MGQVLDLSDQPAAARCGWELEAGTADALDGGLDPLHLVEQLLAALGLGGSGGAGAEAVDVGLLGGEFLLLPLKGRLAGFPLQRFLLEVVAVVAQVAAGDAPFGLDDLVADPIEEGPTTSGSTRLISSGLAAAANPCLA